VNLRLSVALALAAACCACGFAASTAAAFTPAEGRAAADRAALAWSQHHQQRDGAFVDYVSRRPTYGYANVMLGYGLVRAGVRRHDEALVERGFAAIEAVLRSTHPQRGVFDALANATAYEFSVRNLPRDPAFRALRGRWETYLRSISQPYIKSTGLQACTADPACFHNHEAVAAFGDLQLAKTGLSSTVPGAKLASPDALRGSALRVLGEEIPVAIGHDARSTFPGGRSGLGLLSDTGTWPLAYHAFSTAMVAGAASDLGADLPAVTRTALLGAVGALAASIAPDGDVAYLGRRQQQAWALASAVYAATVAERLPGQDARAAGRLRTVADRAFTRLRSSNRFGPGGIGAVPRSLSPRSGYHGVDANEVVPSALTIFLLNLAADEADRAGPVEPAPLPADSDGAFVEPDQTGFAAVRHGDLWYAVHLRTITYDLRYDFGLVALKQRGADGRWRDVVRPRPNTRGPSHDSAGPVIVAGGKRWLPEGESLSVRPGGVVLVRGGFRSEDGVWLRRGVTFRFAPVKGGVSVSFPLRAGDAARMVTFLPRGEAKAGRRTVFDSRSVASLSLRPDSVRFGRGYSSCCDEHLVAATQSFKPRRDQTVVYTLRARAGAAAPGAGQGQGASDRRRSSGGVPDALPLALAALGAAGLAAAALVRRHRRRRRPLSRRG
jgi:hypothetical protein